jgi:hypothetical protein
MLGWAGERWTRGNRLCNQGFAAVGLGGMETRVAGCDEKVAHETAYADRRGRSEAPSTARRAGLPEVVARAQRGSKLGGTWRLGNSLRDRRGRANRASRARS